MKSLSHKLVAFLAIPLTLSCCQREEVYDPESNPREAIILTRAEIDCNEGGKVFSFKMLEKIDSLHKGQSYLFSPLSLFFTYGMTALESDEGLKQAICVALDVDDIYDMNQYAKTILDALPKSDNQSLCSIANIFLYSQDQGLDPSFTGTLTDYYDAFVHKLSDLEDNHSLNLIKQWVKNKTNGHIPNYTPWMYSPEDHYFANVVCFSGKWMIPFDESTNEYFYTESGKKVKTKMMTASKKTRVYWEGKGYSVLELHYGNASFLMNVILPDKGVSCNEIIPCLKEEWNQNHKYGNTAIAKIPEFTFEFLTLPLGKLLNEMNSEHDVLSKLEKKTIIQQASIRVDKEGTKAAATTSDGANIWIHGISPTPTYEFIADRPFFYLITEQSTGAILLMGKYAGE